VSFLSITAKHEYYIELGDALPPPVLATDENRERRLTAAAETFEALRPGDAYEARLAVKIVACGAHAVDSLRMAGLHRDDFAKMTRCRAQAASMMRAEASAKRTLEREQKARFASAWVTDAAPAEPAAASVPPQPDEPQAAPPLVHAVVAGQLPTLVPSAVASQRPAASHAASPPVPAGSAPTPSPQAIARAEAFAKEEICVAARIRQDRGVTPQCKAYFPHLTLPTDPALIDALVRGTSDILTLLDEISADTLDEAA
jgi:hypothetical protein